MRIPDNAAMHFMQFKDLPAPYQISDAGALNSP